MRRLHDALRVPVAALVDFNPDGVRIVHTYRHGSVTSGVEGTRYGAAHDATQRNVTTAD